MSAPFRYPPMPPPPPPPPPSHSHISLSLVEERNEEDHGDFRTSSAAPAYRPPPLSSHPLHPSSSSSASNNPYALSSSSIMYFSGQLSPDLPPEIQAAYRDAGARGLPPGWTCTIDKRNRRKWTAPNNGRSCDSIPKALAISVELGLLPPDTYIPTGATAGRKKVPTADGANKAKKKKKRKRDRPAAAASSASAEALSLNRAPAAAHKGPSKAKAPGKTLVDLTQPDPLSPSYGDLKHYTGADDPASDPEEDEEEAEEEDDDEADESEEERDDETIVKEGPPDEDMDPERSLHPKFHKRAPPVTVHWDPRDRDGNKIGWRVRVEGDASTATTSTSTSGAPGSKHATRWLEGRVVRYDPYTHKHKIRFDQPIGKAALGGGGGASSTRSCWIWLRNEQRNVQLATRMVWAHVKGYAWWPALVVESLRASTRVRDGYVSVEFFGSAETATLRDSPECVRPFSISSIDDVVAKHKKKRNARAYQLACEEYHTIRSLRNDACLFYAERALELAQTSSPRNLVGRRVEVHRTDVNYPYGDTVTAKVRAYSFAQKKWLLAYEYSNKARTKYDASWINLGGKKEYSSLRVLDDKVDKKDLTALVPYVVGFEAAGTTDLEGEQPSGNDEEDAIPATAESSPRQAEMAGLLAERCHGCVEYWKKEDIKLQCRECCAEFHIGCADPPLSMDAWQRMIREDADFVCTKCVTCRGCYQKDVCFGCHAKNPHPPTLSFPKGEQLSLCFACNVAYDEKRYCPNCAHSWDHDRYEKQRAQLEYAGALFRVKGRLSGASGTAPVADTNLPPSLGSFAGDSDLPMGAKVDPSYFHTETTEWGFSEVEMLVCDGCDVWVHAGCSGLTADEYEKTSDGKHPIYSKEFLCHICCHNRCKELIALLNQEDRHGIFAAPVTEKVAPTYRDVIKNPMDLETMLQKAVDEEYLNYAWVRELFELMVLNALTFNRPASAVWLEAKRYYRECLSSVFSRRGKAAPPGQYANEVKKCFEKVEEERKKEEDRVQVDETVEKKDLVAGSLAATVTRPKTRESPPDQSSCLAFAEIKLEPVDAFFCSWMECCYVCASSGAMDTMLFCVDCGEAYHSFCANAPIHSMDEFHATGWRCPNCKICEISGEVPQDENRMLFCEMCDRAFSTDLLDPPLTEAPPGLWICGQCVDCSICRNTAEIGRSLRHWSQDPHKCFRCGGCGGVVDDYMGNALCIVSKKRVRSDDAVAKCASCNGLVRTACNEKARRYHERYGASGAKAKSGDQYICPLCTPDAKMKSDPVRDLQWLSGQAMDLVVRGTLPTNESCSPAELHVKLVEQVEWEMRHLWKQEYMDILREGLRVYGLVLDNFQDARIISQHALTGVTDLPTHVIQRALRFVSVVKRAKWDTPDGVAPERIEVVMQTAKLAAAFLRVADAVLNALTLDMDVYMNDRFVALLKGPDDGGQMWFPLEALRPSGVTDVEAALVLFDSVSTAQTSTGAQGPIGKVIPKAPSPLCGWSKCAQVAQSAPAWSDPRECCLCHLRGDDDAGFIDNTAFGSKDCDRTIRLGRLLPLSDGGFVHTGCALWSSEVWEDVSESLVHAVDKARSRGSQLKCFGCGYYGATVGCNKSNCIFNYHLPCAIYCGVVFTTNQQMFCASHRTSATTAILDKVTFEPMRTLMIAGEKKNCEREAVEASGDDQCSRIGALVVHALGKLENDCDGFHSEDYITPPGYMATRIFWSATVPRERTLYVLKIEKVSGEPQFSITPADDPSTSFVGATSEQVYETLLERVRDANDDLFSSGDVLSKLPAARRTTRKSFGLNGPQFFGFGLDHIRKILESRPGAEALVVPLTDASPSYRFCFHPPQLGAMKDLMRKRAAVKAEQALKNSSGCARTEGIKAVTVSGGSGRITRALVRSAEEDLPEGSATSHATTKKGEDKARVDRNQTQAKYKRMKATPLEHRLVTRRSHIHGWGLFTKLDVSKDDPIVEYMGEIIRQPIADIRESEYEISGEGSCYMFRLDLHRIVDATKIGCMARFMNHSCQPNAYAKIINVDTEVGQDRKIVVFANRDISSGEEITYDYKFPVEDGSLRCTCGAPNCIGRLN